MYDNIHNNLHKIPKYEYESIKNKCYKNNMYNFGLFKFINEITLISILRILKIL